MEGSEAKVDTAIIMSISKILTEIIEDNITENKKSISI